MDTIQNYKKLKILGKGGFGEVWQVEHVVTKEVYAAKYIIIADLYAEEACFEEIKLLQEYRHPCIVEYKGYIKDNATNNFVILLELCAGK